MPRFQVYAIVLTVLTVAWAACITLAPNPGSAGKRIAEDFSSLPLQAGNWHGTNQEYEGAADVLGQLTTCQLLNRTYYNASTGGSAQLSVVLGLDLGDFHQPEVCMGGAGWQLVNQKIITIEPDGAPKHYAVQNVMRNDMQAEIILVYWFYMAGEVTPTLGSKLSQSFRNVFRELEPSAMVKFTSAVEYDDRATAEKAAIGLCVALEKDILKVITRKHEFESSKLAIERLSK